MILIEKDGFINLSIAKFAAIKSINGYTITEKNVN